MAKEFYSGYYYSQNSDSNDKNKIIISKEINDKTKIFVNGSGSGGAAALLR